MLHSAAPETLQSSHNIHEISDPRQMDSTLQAKLDTFEDPVDKFMTLPVVMNKLQKRLGRCLLFWMPYSNPSGFLKGCSKVVLP